jgi:GGDEF domain-containing protein
VLIGGASMLLATLVWRTAPMVLAHDWDARYKVPGEVQGITYLVVLAVLLINSVGFVLMQMELAIERQRQLATHDALTGLYNRSALRELLALCAAQSRRRGEPMAFLMLDIDHFKRVNDQHGHLAGDAVLREVARLARQRLRQADILARYGGEDSAILPATDGAGAAPGRDRARGHRRRGHRPAGAPRRFPSPSASACMPAFPMPRPAPSKP